MTPRRPATFSLFLPQAGFSWPLLRQRAQQLEKYGFDGLWLVDHFWANGMPDADFLEGWTTLAALAEATTKLRLGLLVTCNSYRNPAMLAKTAASVDQVSRGRIELGIGAGWMDSEYKAYGYDFASIGVRLAQLEEGLEIITRMLREPRTTFTGNHYRVEDAPNNPKPAQKVLPLTIGGAGEKKLLKLVARYAQRWNCPMNSAHEMERLQAVLAAQWAAIGRDPSEIVVSEQMICVIGADEAAFEAKLSVAKSMLGGFADIDRVGVLGTPDRVIAQLRGKMARGVTDFAVMFGDLGLEETLELFAREVMPALR
jgi:F420-dependent oxidoreductase-like protein